MHSIKVSFWDPTLLYYITSFMDDPSEWEQSDLRSDKFSPSHQFLSSSVSPSFFLHSMFKLNLSILNHFISIFQAFTRMRMQFEMFLPMSTFLFNHLLNLIQKSKIYPSLDLLSSPIQFLINILLTESRKQFQIYES